MATRGHEQSMRYVMTWPMIYDTTLCYSEEQLAFSRSCRPNVSFETVLCQFTNDTTAIRDPEVITDLFISTFS
jgi:hypothetical protein